MYIESEILPMQAKVKIFLNNISNWVSNCEDVFAIALVGSYASNTYTPNSDIDLVLIINNKNKYLLDLEWVQQFGAVKDSRIEPYGKVTAVRVFYSSGLEVEFGITDLNWISLPIDEGTRKVIDDGIKIIYEKDRILSKAIK